jgi:hypothetical protein
MSKDKLEAVRDVAYEQFEKETAGWNLDTSGWPSIHNRRQPRPKGGEGMIDNRFAPLASDSPGKLRNDLTRFVNRNARDTEVSEALRGVKDGSEGERGIVHFTIRETGQDIEVEVRKVDGLWCGTADGANYKSPTRDGLLSAISRALNAPSSHELTDAQKRECSILCQSAGFYRGVARYVALKTGLDEREVLDDATVLDSRYAHVFNEAVLHCWLALRTDFAPAEDFSDFVAWYAQGRNWSLQLLDGARAEYLRQREEANREALLSPVPAQPLEPEAGPDYATLDSIDGEDFNDLYRRTLREHSKRVKAGA